MGRAMRYASETVADPAGNTVCTVVVDRDGLAVTLMTSIFKRFGSGIAVPGCGFVLQKPRLRLCRPRPYQQPWPRQAPLSHRGARRERCAAAASTPVSAWWARLMQPQGQLPVAGQAGRLAPAAAGCARRAALAP
ncbi:gamma-glutamyltransferase [Cupriavidus basilensis]